MTGNSPQNKAFEGCTAFSYIRYSSTGQRGGHSVKRQTGPEPADWCERNGANLSTKTFKDLGVSAFTGEHRQNPDRHGLALFMNGIREGVIPRGSLLIVESLDRLTREHIRAARRLCDEILDAGVHIVTLAPERVFRHDSTGSDLVVDVVVMLMEFIRAHEESARKSYLIGKAWADKKAKARETGRPITAKLPGWVRLVDEVRDEHNRLKGGRLELIQEYAAGVRRCFELSAHGYGHSQIVAKLTAEGLPPHGKSGRWVKSQVANVLKDRRAVGEYQPRKRDGSEDGPPIPDYFPAVPGVDEELFLRCRGHAKQRMVKPGRLGRSVTNIFSGLITNARDGDSYTLVTRRKQPRGPKKDKTLRPVLLNMLSVEGLKPAASFPYLSFERTVLQKLAEVDPREVMGESPAADEVMALSGELADIETELGQLNQFMDSEGFSPALGRRVKAKEERKREVVKLLDAATIRAANPLSEVWGEAKGVLKLLDTAANQEEARVRIRSVLRRVVDRIHLLVVSSGRTRLAALQVHFVGGSVETRRDYLILHKPPHNGLSGIGRGKRQEEVLWVGSGVGFGPDLDLTNPAHVVDLERHLLAKLERNELIPG